MFEGLGGMLKNIDFKKLDIFGIANKLVGLVPDGKGKQAMDIGLNVAKNGGSPADVKRALENFIPGAKEKLAGNAIWKNIPDDKQGIVTYGQNVAKQFQLVKNESEE